MIKTDLDSHPPWVLDSLLTSVLAWWMWLRLSQILHFTFAAPHILTSLESEAHTFVSNSGIHIHRYLASIRQMYTVEIEKVCLFIHFLHRYYKDAVISVDQDSVRSWHDYVRPRNGFLIEYYNNIIVGEMTSGDLPSSMRWWWGALFNLHTLQNNLY